MKKVLEDALILDHREVAERTFRLRFRSERIASCARPGQFLMVEVHKGTDPLLKRPFSFHRVLPREGAVEILYRVVGRGTWRLSKCSPGMSLSILGPLGNGFSIFPENHPPHTVLIAGGIGIAPLHEWMVQLTANPVVPGGKTITLFYGARTATELISTAPYEGMGIVVHCSTDDGTFGYHGSVIKLFESTIGARPPQPMSLYSCGPLVMLHHVAKWSLVHNTPAQLSLESLMACGIGACLGCALPAPNPRDPSGDHYLHVCKDGPVFEPGSIAWTKLQRQPIAPQIYLYN